MIITIALFGMCIGSFLNVCIVRLPQEESIAYPASHCTKCKHKLKFTDLIPVLSFICLRGRCRYCGEKISKRYALVEFLTGVLAVVTFLKYGMNVEFFAVFSLIAILIVVSFIDFEYQIIPDELVVAGLVVGVILIIYNCVFSVSLYRESPWYSPLIGGILVSGILYIVSKIASKIYKTEDTIGLGDVKLYVPIGLILGYKLVLVAFLLTILIGGIYGIMVILIDKRNSKKLIPFAPFISIGSIIAVFYGYDIIAWYISKFITM